MNCKDCRFCELLFTGLGECRRNAPQPSPVTSEAKWPQVDTKLHWCGEFELKEHETQIAAQEELETWRDWRETCKPPAAIQ